MTTQNQQDLRQKAEKIITEADNELKNSLAHIEANLQQLEAGKKEKEVREELQNLTASAYGSDKN